MNNRIAVFIVGQRITNARLILRFSQGDLLVRYLSHYRALDVATQRITRKLDGPTLSHIENSELGDMYSKVKIKTAELLGLALAVAPDTLYEAAHNTVLPPRPSPLTGFAGGVRFLGPQETQEFVDLPYISTLARAAFIGANGVRLSSLPLTIGVFTHGALPQCFIRTDWYLKLATI